MTTKMNGYTGSCVRKNTSPSTQRTDFGLRAIKTYDNTKSHAGHKEDSWESGLRAMNTNDNVEGLAKGTYSLNTQ